MVYKLQVSVYGAGCWAQHSNSKGVAVVTTGCGEQLIQTNLAKTLGTAILKQGDAPFHLKSLMCDQFLNSELLQVGSYEDKLGGALVAYYDGETVDFHVAFTTDSLAFGFMTTKEEKPRVRVSRNTQEPAGECRLAMEGFILQL